MILSQVKQAISSEIDIKKILNLSDLKSESDVYNALSSLKEKEFKKATRIVFYHSDPLEYTFNDLPADSLIKLQKMLVYIDIPNFFCVIVTNEDIKEELEYVCKNYCVNETPIEFICLK